jgi:hypothetical protein
MVGVYHRVYLIQISQTCEYGLEKNEKNIPSGEIHGVILHLASNVLNICVSLHDHDYILLSSKW